MCVRILGDRTALRGMAIFLGRRLQYACRQMTRSWWLSLVAVSCIACSDEAPRGGLVLMVVQDGSLMPDRLQLSFAAPGQPVTEARWAVPAEAELPVTITFEAKPGSPAELTIDGSLWSDELRLDRREFTVSNVPKERYAALALQFGARCSPSNPSAPECSGEQTCNPETGTCVARDLDAADLPDYEPGLETTLTWDPPGGPDAGDTSAPEAGVSLTGTSAGEGGSSSTNASQTSRSTDTTIDGGTNTPADDSSVAATSDTGHASTDADSSITVSPNSETALSTSSEATQNSAVGASESSHDSTSNPADSGPLCSDGNYWHEGGCAPWDNCDAGYYVLVEGTDEANRICEACPPDTFSTDGNLPVCSPFTHCGFREQQSDGSTTEDVTCAAGDVVVQFGSEEGDTAAGLAVDDAGSVYVVGYTNGTLFDTNAGGWDAFVQKRTATGALAWSEQFGTSNYDRAQGIVANANGDVTVVGWTEGDLAGAHGFADLFLRRYEADGDVVWTSQYGTPNLDMAYSVAETADGSLVVTGRTFGALSGLNADAADFFVSSFSAEGAHQWSQQVGSDQADFRGSAITVDASGDIIAVGNTVAGFGGDDVTVLKLTSEGIVSWQQSFGSNAEDAARAVTTDEEGNIYVAGYTYGKLGASDLQGVDGWVSKRNSAGALIWIDQFGANAEDAALAIAIRGSVLYVAGQWGNESDLSDAQVFVRRYNLDGTGAVDHIVGTTEPEYGYALALAADRIFFAGDTSGDFGATSAGSYDAFVTQVVLP